MLLGACSSAFHMQSAQLWHARLVLVPALRVACLLARGCARSLVGSCAAGTGSAKEQAISDRPSRAKRHELPQLVGRLQEDRSPLLGWYFGLELCHQDGRWWRTPRRVASVAVRRPPCRSAHAGGRAAAAAAAAVARRRSRRCGHATCGHRTAWTALVSAPHAACSLRLVVGRRTELKVARGASATTLAQAARTGR